MRKGSSTVLDRVGLSPIACARFSTPTGPPEKLLDHREEELAVHQVHAERGASSILAPLAARPRLDDACGLHACA